MDVDPTAVPFDVLSAATTSGDGDAASVADPIIGLNDGASIERLVVGKALKLLLNDGKDELPKDEPIPVNEDVGDATGEPARFVEDVLRLIDGI